MIQRHTNWQGSLPDTLAASYKVTVIYSLHTCSTVQDVCVQAVAAQQEEEIKQLQWRAQHNKQQLALYHEAQEAARAEEQAAALLQAEEAAAQVHQHIALSGLHAYS